MKAILYEISISESYLHQSHGMLETIFEIYIPKLKIFINHGGIWKYVAKRYKHAKKIKKLEINDSTAIALRDYVKFKADAEEIAQDILKNDTKGLIIKTDDTIIKRKRMKLDSKTKKKIEKLWGLKDEVTTIHKETKKLNLRDYQIKVRKLAKKKGWDQELFYLFGRMVQEGGELLDAIWQGKSIKETEEEGADTLHFFFQILDHEPKANIDRGMNNKVASNYVNKKKTNVGGKMVRK